MSFWSDLFRLTPHKNGAKKKDARINEMMAEIAETKEDVLGTLRRAKLEQRMLTDALGGEDK